MSQDKDLIQICPITIRIIANFFSCYNVKDFICIIIYIENSIANSYNKSYQTLILTCTKVKRQLLN